MTVPYWAIIVGLVGVTGLAALALSAFATDAAERAAIRNRNRLAVAQQQDEKLLNRMDAAFRRTDAGAQLADYLAGAGLTVRPLLLLVGVVALAFATYTVVGSVLPVWLAWPAALGSGYGVVVFVERRRRRRRERFIQQLPDVARLISNGSRAGLSLLRSLELASLDLEAPAGEELGLVASEVRLGQPLDRALSSMSDRMPSRDVGVMVSTLVIQQRAGGDVVEALVDLAETLEERRQTAREIRVMLVGAVFTSYVIPFLVIGLLLLLNITSPGALDKMVESLFGRVALIFAGILTTIGYLMIRRITKVER